MPDIFLTKRDRVAVVSLNRPDVRNAMTLKMWSELASLFSGLAGDDDIWPHYPRGYPGRRYRSAMAFQRPLSRA